MSRGLFFEGTLRCVLGAPSASPSKAWILLVVACASSTPVAQPDGGNAMDAVGDVASPHDSAADAFGAPDTPSVDPGLCEPHILFGCSSAVERWVWNGSDCETLVECRNMGSATRDACLEAHVACGALPPVECFPIACPAHCSTVCDADGGNGTCDCGDESAFVLIDQERNCTGDDGPAWLFTLAPRVETVLIGRDQGVLREDLSEPSETIRIRLSANRDPFHEPERVLLAAEGLAIERCRTYASPCVVPTAGFIEVETGGAGEMRIDIQLSFDASALFAAGDVHVAPNWFSLSYADGGC